MTKKTLEYQYSNYDVASIAVNADAEVVLIQDPMGHKALGSQLNQVAGKNHSVRVRKAVGHIHYQVDGEMPPWIALVLLRTAGISTVTSGDDQVSTTPFGLYDALTACISENFEYSLIKWCPVPKTTVDDEGVTHYGFVKFNIDLTRFNIINTEVKDAIDYDWALALVIGSYGENTAWSFTIRLGYYTSLYYDILDPFKDGKLR